MGSAGETQPRPVAFEVSRVSLLMGPQIRVIRAAVGAALALALSAALLPAGASAAKPIRGVTFAGSFQGGGSISFSVSADGRRVFDFRGARLRVSCQGGAQHTGFDSPVALGISRKGNFRGSLRADSAHVAVRGAFLTRGRARGRLSYGDRGGCGAAVGFTARALPRARGLRAPVFALAFGGTRAPSDGAPANAVRGVVTGFDQLPDGSFVAAEIRSPDSSARGSIRRIGTDGRLATLLERGPNLELPTDVAALPGGGYLIADGDANCVRRVDTAGAVTTAAGSCGAPGAFSGDGGPATTARLSSPFAVAALADGGFLIADQSNGFASFDASRVRRVTADGTISTVAGNGLRGFSGDGGPATSAALDGISDVSVEAGGGFLITDTRTNRIRRVGPDGTISTVAGSGFDGFGGDGGRATSALLNFPAGVAALPGGGFLIADGGNARLRRVSVNGTITTAAGGGEGGEGSRADRAELQRPLKVVATSGGGVAFDDAIEGLHLIPGSSDRRLLVGFPDRRAVLSARVRRGRRFSVAITSPGRLTVQLRRGGRLLARGTRTVGRGRTAVRLPRAIRRPGHSATYRLTATVTSGPRVATATTRLF